MTCFTPPTCPGIQPRAQGRPLDVQPHAFGALRPSRDVAGDPPALRARLEEDGYLYVPGFFDPQLVRNGRRALLERLDAQQLLDPQHPLESGILRPGAETAFRPDIARANAAVERVVYGPELMAFYDALFGEPALHFDYTWLRAVGPGGGTPPHCDWVYMGRGSRRLLTCWVPYGDVPLDLGGLILLEGSHRNADRFAAYLDKDVDAFCTNRPEEVERVARRGGWSHRGWLSSNPVTLRDKLGGRWLTADWAMGDLVTFRMDMIHASLDNQTQQIRLSSDTRYQPASEPADDRWIGPEPAGHSLAGKRGRIC